jgi:hypothetical protein
MHSFKDNTDLALGYLVSVPFTLPLFPTPFHPLPSPHPFYPHSISWIFGKYSASPFEFPNLNHLTLQCHATRMVSRSTIRVNFVYLPTWKFNK